MTDKIKSCKQTGHVYYEREDDLRHCAQCGGAEASMPTLCPGRMMTALEQSDVEGNKLDFSRGPGIKPQWWVTKERMDQELAYHRAQDGLLEKAQKEAQALREELAETKRPLNDQMARLNESLIRANQEILDLKRGATSLLESVRSYHDVTVLFGDKKIKLFDASYGLRLVCTRAGGWELWNCWAGKEELLASEFGQAPLGIEVAGRVILDMKRNAT